MKPLSHLTVVDLTVNAPGPFCSAILSDLGARVIKVEPPGGDPLRLSSPRMFASMNRGKESIVLDLKTAAGRDVLNGLTARADAVLEGSRPRVAARLGADYGTLSAQNEGLVYCSISGFGQEGPWRDRPGHDINYLALTGYLGMQTAIEGRPWPPAVLVSDLASGLYAAIMVLAALAGRTATGKGTFIDVSMAESVLHLLGPELGSAGSSDGPDRHPNVSYIPHYGLFPCADGKWISLGIVHEDHFWDRFCRAAGLDDLAGLGFDERVARGQAIRDALHKLFYSKTSDEWEGMLSDADVPAAAVPDLGDVIDSPQFRAREAFTTLGANTFVNLPGRLSTGDVAPNAGPPDLGEHENAILAELGISPERVATESVAAR